MMFCISYPLSRMYSNGENNNNKVRRMHPRKSNSLVPVYASKSAPLFFSYFQRRFSSSFKQCKCSVSPLRSLVFLYKLIGLLSNAQ